VFNGFWALDNIIFGYAIMVQLSSRMQCAIHSSFIAAQVTNSLNEFLE